MRHLSAAKLPVQQRLPLHIFAAAMVAFELEVWRLENEPVALGIEKCLIYQRRLFGYICEYMHYSRALNGSLTVIKFEVVRVDVLDEALLDLFSASS